MEFVKFSKNLDKFYLMQNNIVIKDSSVAEGVKLCPNVCIINSTVDEGCDIEQNCCIKNSKLGKNVYVASSYIEDSEVLENCTVGPFTHIRNGSVVGKNCRVGNFVEIKASQIGNGCKMAHLTYVGDAVLGENCNLGCGVVFCNYNGKIKQKCMLGNNVFVGSNVNLVAPLNIGDDVFIAAGSTITKDLQAGTFAIERGEQVIKQKR